MKRKNLNFFTIENKYTTTRTIINHPIKLKTDRPLNGNLHKVEQKNKITLSFDKGN